MIYLNLLFILYLFYLSNEQLVKSSSLLPSIHQFSSVLANQDADNYDYHANKKPKLNHQSSQENNQYYNDAAESNQPILTYFLTHNSTNYVHRYQTNQDLNTT